jgi:hypothetical protein
MWGRAEETWDRVGTRLHKGKLVLILYDCVRAVRVHVCMCMRLRAHVVFAFVYVAALLCVLRTMGAFHKYGMRVVCACAMCVCVCSVRVRVLCAYVCVAYENTRVLVLVLVRDCMLRVHVPVYSALHLHHQNKCGKASCVSACAFGITTMM